MYAGGQCLVDIPIQTGQGSENMTIAEAEAIISFDPKCDSSSINAECELEIRLIKKQRKGKKTHGGVPWLLLMVLCIAILISVVFGLICCLIRLCKPPHSM